MTSTTGRAAAALWAVCVGMLALAASHIAAEFSVAAKDSIHALGKAWIPGAQEIGPYSGKETIALVAWLGSWSILHALLRRRDPSTQTIGIVFLLGIGVATTLLWPPLWGPIVSLLGGAAH